MKIVPLEHIKKLKRRVSSLVYKYGDGASDACSDLKQVFSEAASKIVGRASDLPVPSIRNGLSGVEQFLESFVSRIVDRYPRLREAPTIAAIYVGYVLVYGVAAAFVLNVWLGVEFSVSTVVAAGLSYYFVEDFARLLMMIVHGE